MTLGGGATRHECFSVVASASFQLWPALLHPLLDGLFVTFGRAPRRSLPTPAQLVPKDIPHSSGVVMNAGGAFDDLGDTLQGPHIVGVAVGFGALVQLGLHLI